MSRKLRFGLILCCYFILFSVFPLYGQEVRLGFSNFSKYQRKVEVYSDSIDLKLTPLLKQKQTFFRFTFEFLVNQKSNSNKLVLGIGMIRSNVNSKQIVPRRDSLILTSNNERLNSEIIFLIGKEKVISIANKVNLNLGFNLRTQLNYIDKYSRTAILTTKEGDILGGAKSIIKNNNSFSFGPNTNINLNYIFWKRLGIGTQINSWFYINRGFGDIEIESWDYGKDRVVLKYIPYKHEIDTWHITTSHRFSITLSYNFSL